MKKIFFSGIGGSGVSAIACFLADCGYHISGSDRSFDPNNVHSLYRTLTAKGIHIYPQDGSGIHHSIDLLVFSTAVEQDQPELVKAREMDIPMMSRPDYLAHLVSTFKTVAVAGTSGKSTTAGMLAYFMKRLDMKPNYLGGGQVKQFKNQFNTGNSLVGSSDIMIIEACESDGTIVNYHPVYSIINNLDLDHHPLEETAEMFQTLFRHTKELLITCGDDENLQRYKINQSVRFSIDSTTEYQAKNIEYGNFRTTFFLKGVKFKISLPGKHNLYNALACISLLAEMGVPIQSIAEVLPDFSGIERRFDIHLNNERSLVIDDYAHNPQKIGYLMKTMKPISPSLCYIFQPHGFGPTRFLKKGYIQTFIENLRDRDHLILLPIFYQGGTAAKDISSTDLAGEIKKYHKSVEVIEDRRLILNHLNEWQTYVIFGARDESLSSFAHEIALKLKGS